ncbi:hypothetical protein FACS1894163_10470 [Spirochaetia bacterium]|nr:hypothetical protein FACS1894163_10470 [Spirochaetia bacterium]
MTIEQTVEIPLNHRLTIDVPRDIPAGKTILAFTPAPAEEDIGMDGECHLDHTPNAETAAAIREGRAMMRGEIPANRYHTIEEMLADLKK